MRATVILAGREISQRWRLLAASAAVGLASPFMAQAADQPVRIFSLIVSVALAQGAALLLGGSVIGGDLREGRLSFYFSLPIRGAAIWAGKLAGVIAVCVGIQILAFVPALLLGGAGAVGERGTVAVWVFLLPALAATVVVAHVLGILITNRTLWLLVDLVAVTAIVWVLWGSWRVLAIDWAEAAVAWWWGLLAGAVLVAAVAAGAIQVAGGRVDRRRGQALTSIVLWTVLAGSSLGLVSYTRWVLDVAPHEAVLFDGGVAWSSSDRWLTARGRIPNGRSVSPWSLGEVGGPRNGYRPRFLLHADDGRWLRIGPARLPAIFSNDGAEVFWLQPRDPFHSDLELHRLPVSRASLAGGRIASEESRTSIVLPWGSWWLSVSPRERLLVTGRIISGMAVLEPRLVVTAIELETGRVLEERTLEVALGRSTQTTVEWDWVDDDRVRLFTFSSGSERGLHVFDWQPQRAELSQLAALPEVMSSTTRLTADGERLIVQRRSAIEMLSVDGHRLWRHDTTARDVMPVAVRDVGSAIVYLAGVSAGRGRPPAVVSLEVLDARDGQPLGSLPIAGWNIELGEEVQPGKLLVVVRWTPPPASETSRVRRTELGNPLALFDIATLELDPLRDLRLVGRTSYLRAIDWSRSPAGSWAAGLLGGSRLSWLDAEKRELSIIGRPR